MIEGIGAYRGLQASNMCEVSFAGRVSAPAGVAPEALEESLCSSKGYKHCPTGLLHWGGRPAFFSAGNVTLSAALGILHAGTATRRLA